MPNVQPGYQAYPNRWPGPGHIPDQRPHRTRTLVLETAAGMAFGVVGVRGTADNQVRVSEASRPFAGISLADPTQDFTTADLYPQYARVAVRDKGPVVCIASVAVVKGDPVYFVPGTGVLTNVSNSSANTLIAGAIWDTTQATPGGLAIVLLG